MTFSKKFLILVVGPTASGKTTLSVKLAKHLGTEIISADSRQFYKEIAIGTAAPEPSSLQHVPHHFVGHLSIFDEYNVAHFEQDVLAMLSKLFKITSVVIMSGGSGLYIDAVCKGIDKLPDSDPKLRKKLEDKFKTEGIEAIQFQLRHLDPEYYNLVDIKNPKRLMRAIEICLQSGEKYSDLRHNKPKKRAFEIIKVGLELPRKELFNRINRRADQMLIKGWVDEAKAVFPYCKLNALNTLGFKELFTYLEGKCSLDFALEKIKTNTRRYAKRQLTWFKKDKEIHWFKPTDTKEIISFVEKQMTK